MTALSNSRVAWFNGQWMPEGQVVIPFRDRSWKYGDGAFDMTRTFNHRAFRLQEHIDRFYRSLRYIGIDPGMQPKEMIRLSEEITKRGGTPKQPVEYKHRYHELLMQRIDSRREALRSGAAEPESMLVPGSFDALRALQERDVELYLASGTDERYVIEEAELLGLVPYFGRHIYGALDDHKSFSKQMVIERILRENNVEGSRLLGLGDGYVEIDNIKQSGGTAIAVASDEAGKSGKPDPWKRDRLIGVGADVVIPDFRDFRPLCEYLWNRG